MLSSHLVIIKDANDEFGRSLALSFAKALLSKIHFVLVGPAASDLQTTADLAAAIRPNSVTTELIVTDSSGEFSAATSTAVSEKLFFSHPYDRYTYVIFVNNGATIQPIMPIGTAIDPVTLANTLQQNITTPMFFTSEFLRSLEESSVSTLRAAVVNISTLWAIEAGASFGVYGASKAAMEMFYEVLAKETYSSGNPVIKVLNYAPGPVDDATQSAIRDSSLTDPQWLSSCCQMKADGMLIPPDVSASKCALLIIQELYQSGDRVDFYDQVEGIDYPRKVITTCCANPNCQCGVNCKCSKDNGPQCGGCQSFMLGNR